MDFGQALHALRNGKRVQRVGWNGKGMWLEYVAAKQWSYDQNARETLPFIAMKTADDKFVPWLASQTDILANDWQSV